MKDDSDKQLGNTSLLCLTEKTPSVQIGLAALENRQISKVPDIEEFWELEKVGIHDSPHEDDDARVLDQFNKSIYLSEGRYQVQWPWKADVAELPTNYQLAIGRLRSLEKRLKGDKGDLKAKYQAVIDDQLAKGVIEKVTSTCSPEHPVHYIPHHPIIRPTSTTTKVRIVYDASAKSRREAKSLNECLYRGPVMLPDLCAVLIRFRLNPIALVSDIEKAFLQMALQPKDRDVTRFLWFKDPDAPFSLDNMMTLRFCRVPFGVISSPFLLGGTVQYHLALWNNKTDLKTDIKETTAEKIAKDIYVDNVSSTVTTSEEAITFYTEAKHIFNSAGMNLTEWCSNMPEFEAVIPHADRSSNRTVKVLGMKWDSERDTMYLSNTSSHNATATTKRQILRCVASVFDPLGLFQPATLAAKCLLRDLWLSNRGWDEALDEAEEARWATVKASLSSLGDIRLPRQTGVVDEKSMLVVFCDASADAYATAVYLRSSTDAGTTYKSNLIFAKSRLSPRTRSIEKVSIPRLELLGVVIGCRAAKFCRQSLGCKNLPIVLFTDSSCVLTWLTTSKLLSAFVSNRIQEIKSAGISEFRHVSSSDNPADLCTRGVTGSEMATCHLWWHGPAWIGKPVIQWPVSSVASSTLDSVNASVESECKKGAVFHTILAGEDHGGHEKSRNLLNVDPETYSTMSRLLRLTTRILKFIKLKLWNHVPLTTQVRFPTLQKLFDGRFEGCHPTAKDINVAKQLWVKRAQVDVYSDVFAAIRSGKRHYLIRQLNLTIDDTGLLRCAGRFDYAETSPQILRPALLPKKHPITSLVVQQCHGVLFHAGVAHTLSQIRRQYWIPCGRASVRREVTKCLRCRKLKGAPFPRPIMPPLPKERLSRSNPFQFTGLDYLGPVTVSIGEGVQKMWICLFTCLAVRAIHLEWVVDCSAQSFVDCLSRFVARRGCPLEIISDNAPQFRSVKELVDKTWHSVFTNEMTTSYLATNGIRWKFITELAPWQGGFYERLVGVVKRAMNAVVGRRLLKWDEFATLVVEAEAIVNSRPLTYLYEDFPSGKVLRPCDFLIDLSNGTPDVDPAIRPEGGVAGRHIILHWKYKQKRLNMLWKHWHDDYLLSLRERGSTEHRNPRVKAIETPQVNQVVIVKNPGMPRGTWKLARVTKIINSGDGIIRSVELQLPNRATIRRSISHLYPIELPPVLPEKGSNEHADIRDDTSLADHDPELIVARSEADANQDDPELYVRNPPDEDEEDRFSGFSESEVYGEQSNDLTGMCIDIPNVRDTISAGMMDNALVGMQFQLRQ